MRGNHEQDQKKIASDEGLRDALQSHHASQPGRFRLERPCACSKKDHEDRINEIEKDSNKQRVLKNIQKDHMADRGHVSMSHHNMVQKTGFLSESNEKSSSNTCNGQLFAF